MVRSVSRAFGRKFCSSTNSVLLGDPDLVLGHGRRPHCYSQQQHPNLMPDPARPVWPPPKPDRAARVGRADHPVTAESETPLHLVADLKGAFAATTQPGGGERSRRLPVVVLALGRRRRGGGRSGTTGDIFSKNRTAPCLFLLTADLHATFAGAGSTAQTTSTALTLKRRTKNEPALQPSCHGGGLANTSLPLS